MTTINNNVHVADAFELDAQDDDVTFDLVTITDEVEHGYIV